MTKTLNERHTEIQIPINPQGDIALGFNFPCPCRRTGPGNGILTNWTKAYACEGVLGKDVAVMLQDALDRNELSHIKVE